MTNILYIINIFVAGLSIFIGTAGFFYMIYASDLPNWVKFSFGVVLGVIYGFYLMLLTDG